MLQKCALADVATRHFVRKINTITVLQDSPNCAASRRLVEMLMDIENRLLSSQSVNALLRDEESTSRQRVVSNLIGWTSMLHPLPEIPINDKVQNIKINQTILIAGSSFEAL